MPSVNIDFQVLATTLMGTVSDTFESMCKEKLSSPPQLETRPVEAENGKVIISGFRKFAVKCYLSVIYFYLSEADKQKDKSCGCAVLYVKESGALNFVKAMEYMDAETATEEEIQDMCGEFCNVIVGAFRQDLVELGYTNLEMGTPINYRDSIPEGVPINKSQKDYQELRVFLFGANPVVMDIYV